jgi:hypothetical protein
VSNQVRRRAPAVVLLLVLALGAGCTPHPVGPARTLHAYEAKAGTSASSAASVVATVQLAAETSSRGRAFGPYLSQLISEQEGVLEGVIGTFASIQPPSDTAGTVRDDLTAILDDALRHVTDVRIAVRRGRLADLADVAKPLHADATALDAFLKAHQ